MTKKKNIDKSNFDSNNPNDFSIITDQRFSLLEKTSIKLFPILLEIQRRMAIEDYRSYSEGGVYITGPIKLAKGGRGNVSPNRKGNVAPLNLKVNDSVNNYSSKQPGPDFYDCGNSDMKNILGYLN